MEAHYKALSQDERHALFIRNLDTMRGFFKQGVLFVACWGANATKIDDTANRIAWLFCHHSLGVTKAGHPRHPLYLPNDVQMQRYLLYGDVEEPEIG